MKSIPFIFLILTVISANGQRGTNPTCNCLYITFQGFSNVDLTPTGTFQAYLIKHGSGYNWAVIDSHGNAIGYEGLPIKLCDGVAIVIPTVSDGTNGIPKGTAVFQRNYMAIHDKPASQIPYIKDNPQNQNFCFLGADNQPYYVALTDFTSGMTLKELKKMLPVKH